MSSSQAHTKEFFDLIRNIGETKSKQEEDKIIIKEIATLKQHFTNSKITQKVLKEYVVRALYCEMLGHDASFAYFNAVQLTSSNVVLEKRVGYLVISLSIPKGHELLLLLIANLQKDLKSTNYLIVCAALTAAAKLVNEETIPALIPSVVGLRKHTNAIVRKKTLALLQTFYQISSTSVPGIMEHAKEGLCDRDPSVMGASLCLLFELVQNQENLQELKELAPSMVNILKQVVDHRLPRDYDYHRLPAPWIQIKLLQILGILGKNDKMTSETMYDTLREVMQRGDNSLNIGHAVVYETVKTITSIYPNNLLLENAASAISRFVTSSNHNLKYLGIVSLTEIVKINPKYATQHQMVVIDCLEDIDETIRRRTLSLLYTMTNGHNVTVIVKKLLEYAKKSLDSHMREELIHKISLLAERFCPSIFWYIDTMNVLFEVGSEFVPPRAIQNMVTVIAEGVGTEESAEEDDKMRTYCVDSFFEITEKKPVIHDLHLQVIAWVLGEYGYLSSQHSHDEIIERLCDITERQLEHPETRSILISALMKLIAQTGGDIPAGIEEMVQKYQNSKNVDLQQRCYEFLQLVEKCSAQSAQNRKAIMEAVLPTDGSCEEIEVDTNLSWLQRYVEQALHKGARPYLQPDNRSEIEQNIERPKAKQIIIAPYVPTSKQYNAPVDHPSDASVSMYPNDHKPLSTELDPELLRNKKRLWTDDDDDDEPKLNLPSSGGSSNPYHEPAPPVQGVSQMTISNNTYEPVHAPSKPKEEVKKVSAKSRKFVEGVFGPEEPTEKPKKTAPKRRARSIKKDEPDVPIMQEEQVKPPQRRVSNAKPPVVAQEAPKANLITLDDLLGDFTSTPTQAYNSMEDSNDIFKGMQVEDKEEDMFEGMDVGGSSGYTEYEMISTTPQKGKKLVDTLFDMSSHQVEEEQDTGISAFGSLLKPSKKQAQMSSTNDDLLFPSNVKRQPALLTKLINTTSRANEEPLTLCRDSFINVEHYKFWKDDAVVLALVFNTERGYTLSNITCQFQPPTKFEMKFETDSPNSSERNNSITINRLEPGTPVTLLVNLRLTSFGFGLGFMGTIIYTDNEKQIHNQTLSIKLDVVDLMRPAQLTSQEFGQLWTSYSHEKKIQVKGNHNVQSFTSRVEADLKVKIIQIIDQEAIGAAQLINTNEKILFHGKVLKTAVAITIKTKDKPTSEMLCQLAGTKLV